MKRGSSRLATPIWATVLTAFLLAGCGAKEASRGEMADDVLLVSGHDVLTLNDVLQKIPVGLEPSDSAALFHNVVDNWVKTRVLSSLAESKLPDLDEIDRQVEAFRNRLIVAEYIERMSNSCNAGVSPDSIADFYSRHKDVLLTEVPLVKGIFVKMPDNAEGLDEIRDLVFSGDDNSVDKLEKSWLDDAIQYDYFVGKWIDWQTVANQIPYRFYDPDAFLKANSNFETSYKGSTYILHISDYLPSGSVLPLEYASPLISEMLEKAKITSFEDALVSSLIKKALKDGNLVAEGYDLGSHEVTLKSGMESEDELTNEAKRNITNHSDEKE